MGLKDHESGTVHGEHPASQRKARTVIEVGLVRSRTQSMTRMASDGDIALWCPEAEIILQHWIPEGSDILAPQRNESKVRHTLDRGISLRVDAVIAPRHIAAPHDAPLQIIHASQPFFAQAQQSHIDLSVVLDPQSQQERELDPQQRGEKASQGSVSTASTTVSKRPGSLDHAVASDPARMHPELSCLPLTPAGLQGKDAIGGEPAQCMGEEQTQVLHSGRGAVGRRRITASCNGRYSKCQLVRSHSCCLRQTGRDLEFVFAESSALEETILLSSKTALRVKGGRVELVQQDGRHMWLWGLPPHTLVTIHQTFAQVASAQPQTEPLTYHVVHSVASAQIQKTRASTPDSVVPEDACYVELGFAPNAAIPHAPSQVSSGSELLPCSSRRNAGATALLNHALQWPLQPASSDAPTTRTEENSITAIYKPIASSAGGNGAGKHIVIVAGGSTRNRVVVPALRLHVLAQPEPYVAQQGAETLKRDQGGFPSIRTPSSSISHDSVRRQPDAPSTPLPLQNCHVIQVCL